MAINYLGGFMGNSNRMILKENIAACFKEHGEQIKEITQLKEELKKEREVVDYYGHEAFDSLENSELMECGYLIGLVAKKDREWCGKNQLGGKKARQRQKERTISNPL